MTEFEPINLGSSPRGRGKLFPQRSAGIGQGLIPAWAGKTSRETQCWWGSKAHPRVGGENVLGGDEHFGDHGSSPRGRGKPSDAASDAAMYGLIPAWAGKTGP